MVPVLFENDDILVVNKPEGLLCIPGRDGKETSLATQLTELAGHKIYVVHRLDREVSGVMLFAKHANAHRYLNGLFEKRQINKTYVLVAHGNIAEPIQSINAPLREFGSGRMGVDDQLGKPSTTRIAAISQSCGYTLVKAYPLTGRRHQIRVHMYHIGHPIAGDLKYGDKTLQQTIPRLMLHAFSLSFVSSSNEPITVTIQPPVSFTEVLEKMGFCAEIPL
jgi:RluA family pseudouridine synthase